MQNHHSRLGFDSLQFEMSGWERAVTQIKTKVWWWPGMASVARRMVTLYDQQRSELWMGVRKTHF
jgi:hypothetical protein